MASRVARSIALALTVAALCSTAGAGVYDAAVLADTPVRYYRLGEAAGPAAFDSSTYAANGTYSGLAAGDFAKPGALAGTTNTSVWLDGTDAIVSAPSAAELNITGDIAIEFWYNKTSEAGDWQRIVGKGDSTANRRNYGVWEEGGAPGHLLFQQYNSGGASVLNFSSATSIGLNVWTHVVATVSGSAARIYINGGLNASATRTGTPGTNSDPLIIGYGQAHTYFPGYVDEVAVYGHALTLSQVRQHYLAALAPPTVRHNLAVIADGSNAYYRYDDASSANGAVVADSANGNPATYRGSVTLVPSQLPGILGKAASFNGSTDYIQLPTAPFGAFPTGGSTNAYTLSFETWFQTSGTGVILGHTNNVGTPGGAAPTGYVPAVYVDNNGQVRASIFWHNGADAAHQIVSSAAYNDGDWHHLVDVYNNGTEYLYLDGTLIGQQVYAEFGYSATYNYYLGTGYAGGSWPSTNGGWFFFNGRLDDTSIYPNALSLTDISEHYQTGLVQFELVPEPASTILLGLGVAFLARRRRSRGALASSRPCRGAPRMKGSVLAGILVAVALAGFGTAALGGVYDAAVLADTPVRYYRLGEAAGPTAFDSSSYAGNGTYNNLAAGDFAKPGALASSTNTSVWLAGSPTNATVTAADANELDIAGDIAIEFWYKKTAEAGDWQRIVGKGDSNAAPTRRNYGVWEEGGAAGRLLFQQYDGTGNNVLNFFTNTSVGTNVWTHVVATVSGTAATIYMNGLPDATATRTGAAGTNSDQLIIGYGQLHTYFPGYVDEVAVYNHALSAARVQAHYNARIGSAPYEQVIPLDGAGTYWRFEDASSASGQPAADSVDSNPATYQGSVGFSPSTPVGIPAQAAVFNGTSAYLQLPTAPFGAVPTGGNTAAYVFSFETWFKTNANGVILGQTNNVGTPGGAAPTGYVPALYVDLDGKVRASMFWHNGADAAHQIISPNAYNDGSWHYLVDVYSNGTEYLYLDGSLVGQQTFNEYGYSGAYYYYLGTGYAGGTWPRTNGGWFFFNGMLDETGAYSLALNSLQISSHYLLGMTAREAIPEPATLALLSGALALLARRRKGVRAMARSASLRAMVLAGIVLGMAASGHAGLIAYWPFNDASGSASASNLIPGGPGATLRNMDPSTSWVAGRFGGALNFTSADDYLDVLLNPASSLNIPETGVTVSMWFRTTANGGLFNLNNPERGGENDRNVWVEGTNVRGRVWPDETITATPPSGSYADGAWHHVVHQYGAAVGGQRVYVDGQLRAQGTVGTSNFNWRTHAAIGWSNYQGSFNGQIDDVAVWNSVIAEPQIQALAAGTASPGDSLNAPHARLVSSGSASVMGAAYAQNLGSGQIVGPVHWQIHKMDVTTGSAIAYVVPWQQAGNQSSHQGSLGLDFNVNSPITVTQLGVFDDLSNGLNRPLIARLYDRSVPGGNLLATLNFSQSDPGTLIGGSRFKTLATPIVLNAGFQGRMVAEGYGPNEQDGNLPVPPWTTDTGGGALSFVGNSYYGNPGTYPTNADGGPANRYAAGTFMFDYSTLSVGQLLAEGAYNVGDDVNDGFFFYLGGQPGQNTLRLTVSYGGQEATAFADIVGVPEPASLALLGVGMAFLARRRRQQGRAGRRVSRRVVGALLGALALAVASTGLALPTPSAWYKLDETGSTTINDSIAGGSTGSITGGTNYQWVAPGLTAGDPYKLSLNPSGTRNTYVSVPDQARLDAANDLTVSMWFNRSTPTDWMGIIAKRDDPGGRTNFGLNLNQGSNMFQWYYRPAGLSYQSTFSGFVPQANKDWFFTGTIQQVGGNIATKMYLNAIPVGANTFSGQTFANSQNNVPVTIGASFANGEVLPGTVDDVRVWNANALTPPQVRELYEMVNNAKMVSLADMVGGGNGFGTGSAQGINPTTGAVITTHGVPGGDGPYPSTYHVSPAPYIDGVWVPDLGSNTISSTGLTFNMTRNTDGNTYDNVWNGINLNCGGDLGSVTPNLNLVDFTTAGHSLIGLHANKGITFDLQEISQATGMLPARFLALAGTAYASNAGSNTADYWVIVDGVLKENRLNSPHGVGNLIDVALDPDARFLTLIGTDGGDGYSYDQVIFGDPYVVMQGVAELVPEPASLALLGLGLGLMARRRLRAGLRSR